MNIIKNLSPYGICGVLGFICGVLYLYWICNKKNFSFDTIIYIYVWSALGAIAGAKLLYLILQFPAIINYLLHHKIRLDDILSILNGGFIFYGGLIGAIVMILISCKYFNQNTGQVFSIMTPALPLAHAFGRIGCSIVGCCYGKKVTSHFGIMYKHSKYAPNGIYLFPIQIIEALGDIFIFILLIYLITHTRYKENILSIYLTFYALLRFFLEFFRGDVIRGFLWILSTSQWISAGILLILLLLKFRQSFHS